MATMQSASLRLLASVGALLAAAAVALSAWAAHAAAGDARAQLLTAAAVAYGHGVALAALARTPQRRVAVLALAGLLLGTALFSGGLVGAQLAGVHARTAPFGGGLLILAWLLYAFDAQRG